MNKSNIKNYFMEKVDFMEKVVSERNLTDKWTRQQQVFQLLGNYYNSGEKRLKTQSNKHGNEMEEDPRDSSQQSNQIGNRLP